MTRLSAVALALLLVLAGCVAVPPRDAGANGTLVDSPGGENPPDPEGDPLGWESGYWYDEPLDVNASDGFGRSELDAVVARTMARLERLREREFTEEVSVEVITREQFRERNVFRFQGDPVRDQLWESLFVVGERTASADELDDVYGGSVVGYYSGGDIVVVSEEGSAVQVRPSTLSHELTHALQDQQFDRRRNDGTNDGGLAARALVEGEANYLMDRYLDRCESEWDCIPRERGGATGTPPTDGIFLSVYVPYSDGPTLVETLLDRGGWPAVDRAWRNPPVSTEQVIHPRAYPDETPAEVGVPDRSKAGWERVGGDRIGEATLFSAFVANGVVPADHLATDARRYNYSHPITAGWGGDRIVAYRNGDRFGYVLEPEWDTPADAEAFAAAYRELLSAQGAEDRGGNVFRIPDDDEFGDAFRVVRDGRTVRVVNAPSTGLLSAVHRPESGG
jgi:hypothetical protein